MKRIFFLLLAGAFPGMLAYSGCSDTGGSSAAGGDATLDALPDGGWPDDAPPNEPDADAGPVYDENGWLRVDFDPDYPCAFYTAPSADKMPPPIVWEACTGPLPAGISCQQMKAEWGAPGFGPFGQTASAWSDVVSGRVYLAIRRNLPSRAYDLVAEADGPVHHAISMAFGGPCYLYEASVRQGHVTHIADREDKKPVDIHRWGAVGGAIDEPARTLASYPNQGTGGGRGYFAGRDAFFEYGAGGPIVFDWTSKQIQKLSLNAPGEVHHAVFQNEALFIQISDLTYGRIVVWTQATGLQDLISYGSDVSHNAKDVGTDGVDLAWVEGVGRTEGGVPFASMSIMTSPFAGAASGIQARRVRSESYWGFGTSPFVVGCGYAAREYATQTETGTRIVRLSDGQMWKLTSGGGKSWQKPVAITCQELFVNTRDALDVGSAGNLARVRLDSLGPGEAAD